MRSLVQVAAVRKHILKYTIKVKPTADMVPLGIDLPGFFSSPENKIESFNVCSLVI